MVWGAFSAFGKATLEEIEGKQNSAQYINVLEKRLLSIMNHLDTNNPIFQQDKAAIHTSKPMIDWFLKKNI